MIKEDNYSNRFNFIGNSYEEALAKYPNARTDHFWLLEHANLSKDSAVLEVSGGTGFLTEKIAQTVTDGEITVHDISENVIKINKEKLKDKENINYIISNDMSFSDLPDENYDVSINLGGFHHIEDQAQFLKGVMKKIKKGGLICIGDFADHSPVQRYFDERIHHLTETGHMGLFASESTMVNLGRICGASSVIIERKKVPFIFHSEQEIGEFFRLVHDLNQTTSESYQEINDLFEIQKKGDELHVMMDYIYACFKK